MPDAHISKPKQTIVTECPDDTIDMLEEENGSVELENMILK